MKRVHLFEIEDQQWCPKFIRETTTDFLFALYRLQNIYEPALKLIDTVLEKTQVKAIIDCCSGSGGPMQQLREYLDQNGKTSIPIILTDKYPNADKFDQISRQYPNRVLASKESIDATCLPKNLEGMRTLFSSFHHFKPDKAVEILQNAVDCGAPIGIFECTQRQFKDFLRVLLSPLMMWVMVPFAKRLTLKKFIFTYIVPITPFSNMWDYFVSNMRTYSPKELHSLLGRVNAPGYQWEVGRVMSPKSKTYITYLIGYNRERI